MGLTVLRPLLFTNHPSPYLTNKNSAEAADAWVRAGASTGQIVLRGVK